MANKIRSNDLVIILSGKDKGKTGKIKSIIRRTNKAIVFGINIVKKHQKFNSKLKKSNSGIIEKEAPISISNLSFLNSKNNKFCRIGFKYFNNKKVRFLKSNGEIVK